MNKEHILTMSNTDRIKSDAITIGELIAVLKKYDKNLPVYIRPKYSGDIKYTDEIPIKINGIAEMHPENTE